MVDRGIKTPKWLDCLTHTKCADLGNDKPKDRWAGSPSLALSVSVNQMKITH